MISVVFFLQRRWMPRYKSGRAGDAKFWELRWMCWQVSIYNRQAGEAVTAVFNMVAHGELVPAEECRPAL